MPPLHVLGESRPVDRAHHPMNNLPANSRLLSDAYAAALRASFSAPQPGRHVSFAAAGRLRQN
jgi:hypothetical protein